MSRESLPKQVDFPDSKTLLEVINIQTEIVKMGVSLGSVMALVCERTQALTQAGPLWSSWRKEATWSTVRRPASQPTSSGFA